MSGDTMKEDIILRIVNLHKVYAEGTPMEVHALKGIDLLIKKGEMVAIMGPSGCGKTTLLNIIGGLDNQDIKQRSIGFNLLLLKSLVLFRDIF